jgi:hypothetical protein
LVVFLKLKWEFQKNRNTKVKNKNS